MLPCVSYQNSCLVTENTDIVTDISCQSVMFKNLVWKVSVGLYLKDEGAITTLGHGDLAMNVLTTRATVPHSSLFKFLFEKCHSVQIIKMGDIFILCCGTTCSKHFHGCFYLMCSFSAFSAKVVRCNDVKSSDFLPGTGYRNLSITLLNRFMRENLNVFRYAEIAKGFKTFINR